MKLGISFLSCLICLCAFGSPKNCRKSTQFDDGAFQCSAAVEVKKDFNKNYAEGVVESKTWKLLFEYCDMVGKRLSDSSLIPVPIAQSKKSSSRTKDQKIIYELSMAFYCGGI